MAHLTKPALWGAVAGIALPVALPIALPAPAHAQTLPTAAAYDAQKCVNIGNYFETPADNNWGGSFALDDFNLIKAAGFDTIRLPVRWSDYTGPAPDFAIDPAFFAEVEAAVDAALAQGLNVVLNVHHFDALMENPAAEYKHFAAIWRQLATHYADYPDDLWFEVLNEPTKKLRGEKLINAQTAASLVIRETNPDRIIILMGENWSGINSLYTNMAPLDDNFVYSFHYYDPFNFTHQYASWVDQNLIKEKRGWGSRADRDELTRAVATATEFQTNIGHPVFLGEFGVNAPVKQADRVKWVGAVATAMEAADVGWCLWAFSNTFALYDRDTGFDTDMLDALGLKTPDE